MNRLLKPTYLKLIIIALVQVVVFQTFAQEVNNVSADYDKATGKFIVNYDLKAAGKKKERYQVRLYYSQDAGKHFSDTLRQVSGDVGDAIIPGINKEITWNYFVEDAEFDGKNVIFKVEAERDWQFERQRLATLGGPESALNSLLVPGWGDQKVRNGKNYWWITAGTWGLLGAGVITRISADQKYQDYRQAENESEASDLINQARSQGDLSTILLIAGGVAWITDVGLVLYKGIRNKKEKKYVQQKLKSRSLSLGAFYHPDLNTPGLSLKFKF